MISLARMTRVLEVDVERGCVVVEPGVTNLDVTRAVAEHGFYYAPDPSSQQVCTIGGNVAENSGGAHCLKYGFTVNHVLAADVVLADGEQVTLSVWDDGPDLLGVFVGSEGTLGIATALTLRVLRAPEAVRTLLAGFGHTDEAGVAVSRDHRVGDHAGGDRDDGRDRDRGGRGRGARRTIRPARRGADRRARRTARRRSRTTSRAVERICAEPAPASERVADERRGPRAHLARAQGGVRRDGPDQPRLLRAGRRRPADAAAGGAAPHRRARGAREGLRVGNVFHAGDGNLHPLVLYDHRVAGQAQRAQAARRADPRGLHRRRRLDHRRARRRHRQGVRDAAALQRGRPRRDGAAAPRASTRAASPTRARSSRRRGCAARCRAPTAPTRSSARDSIDRV